MRAFPPARGPRFAFSLVPLLAAGALLAAGQQPKKGPKQPYLFHSTVGVVNLEVTVFHGNTAVLGLPASDFTVLENGVPQSLTTFSGDDRAVSIGVLVDGSGSMEPKRPVVNEAAIQLVKKSNPADEVFVGQFNRTYKISADFTHQIPVLQKALQNIGAEGGTALYDAVVLALGHLNEKAVNDKKVLYVITDGEDDASSHTLTQALRMVQVANGTMIYCLGILDPDHDDAAEVRTALQGFAGVTGGSAFFTTHADFVASFTDQVAHNIRSQYNLEYTSNQGGDAYRAITITVKDPRWKGLVARARSGYFPEGEQAAAQLP